MSKERKLGPPSPNPIADERVKAVLERRHHRGRRQVPGIVNHFVGQALIGGVLGRRGTPDAEAAFFQDKLISINRDQGWLIYQMCRSLVELREGDALKTLVDCSGSVDFLLVDGFPKLARPVIELMASQLKQGVMVVCDNVGHFPRDFADYLDYVRSYQRCCLDFESQIRSELC
jgi:hypothetical protein